MLKGYLVPHPPLIIPGVGKGDEIPDTRHAYQQIAAEIKEFNPETVVIISPHSIMYEDYFHIAPGKGASGDFGAFGAKNIKFSVSYDSEFAGLISRLANEEGLNAGPLGKNNSTLDHGVMVPLYFFKNDNIVRVSLSGLSLIDHYRLGMCISRAAGILKRKTVIIASGDMSHKLKKDGPYGFAAEGPKHDALVCDCIHKGDIRGLMSIDNALRESAAECGFKSLVMLAGVFDGHDFKSRLLSYECPYGVGYLTASFTAECEAESLLPVIVNDMKLKIKAIRSNEDEYVRLARLSVEHFVRMRKIMILPENISPELLKLHAGVFVSIKKDGMLRGCIGTIEPAQKNIAAEIVSNGVSAASCDPRFDPVEPEELESLIYSVDVLSAPEAINGPDGLDVKRYGVIVKSGKKRGLLLPDIEGVDTVGEQIEIALKKAGIKHGETYALERFEVVRHQ